MYYMINIMNLITSFEYATQAISNIIKEINANSEI